MATLLSIGSAGLSVGGARPAAAQTSRRCVPNVRMSADEFTVAVLGDLHLDPRKMEDYGTGRGHVLPILEDAKAKGQSPVLCSLGDLGESKSVRPEETQELFAGTTACHELAAELKKGLRAVRGLGEVSVVAVATSGEKASATRPCVRRTR